MDERGQLVRRYGSNFLRYILVPIAVIALVWLIIWFFFIRDTDRTARTDDRNGSSQAQNEAQNGRGDRAPSEAEQEGRTGASGGQTQGDNKQGQSGEQTPAPGAGSGQLAESGPGEVAAIFIGAALISLAGRYYYLNRKYGSG